MLTRQQSSAACIVKMRVWEQVHEEQKLHHAHGVSSSPSQYRKQREKQCHCATPGGVAVVHSSRMMTHSPDSFAPGRYPGRQASLFPTRAMTTQSFQPACKSFLLCPRLFFFIPILSGLGVSETTPLPDGCKCKLPSAQLFPRKPSPPPPPPASCLGPHKPLHLVHTWR